MSSLRLILKVRRAGLTLATTCICLCCLALPGAVRAQQSLSLRASLTPDLLDRETTIGFDFAISAPHGQVPSPLTGVALRYPGDVGLVVSGLGLDVCTPTTLRVLGPAGCPAEARMGTGSATVEIPVGPVIVRESALIAVERAETKNERFALTFEAEGTSPIVAHLALPALLLSAESPFGGSVAIEPPLVPSVPEAPNVSVVRLRAEIGPQHLTYFRRQNGRLVPYTPRGVRLPKVCPSGGFPFTVAVNFLDGTHARARTTVPCPPPLQTKRRGSARTAG
jgi:hypothetical protein